MPDELKDQRVVTMMSPKELETIDEWMFKHRIRSRGEAIRRLCEVGMEASLTVPAILAALQNALNVWGDGVEGLRNARADPQMSPYQLTTLSVEFEGKIGHSINDLGIEVARLLIVTALSSAPVPTADIRELLADIREKLDHPEISRGDKFDLVVKLLHAVGPKPRIDANDREKPGA